MTIRESSLEFLKAQGFYTQAAEKGANGKEEAFRQGRIIENVIEEDIVKLKTIFNLDVVLGGVMRVMGEVRKHCHDGFEPLERGAGSVPTSDYIEEALYYARDLEDSFSDSADMSGRYSKRIEQYAAEAQEHATNVLSQIDALASEIHKLHVAVSAIGSRLEGHGEKAGHVVHELGGWLGSTGNA